ncbi:DUF1674 domain-containing protein [Methylocaldum sp.]|uniref:DUF1674 domain-containing protein n=1 Tax=Methylocaldum sp. TaxID=1969727 RepID=UPI002D69A7FB|nr:DUF1674 domain-containing protein [Methylocaldum sp.]HYE34242.1 DUF1674 domain-containing protein [Methylocaldum sp.]
MTEEIKPSQKDQVPEEDQAGKSESQAAPSKETKRPEPTRYGDWEKNGRCIDF